MINKKLEELISTNKEIFNKELKKVIKPTFTGLENPKKYKEIIKILNQKSKRSALPRQARLVAAAAEHLKKNKSLIISAEMGSGKTDMAIKISMTKEMKVPVYFIACPPHLVKTWQEELVINYKDSTAYKAVVIKRWEDLIPYTKRQLWNDGVKYYFIVARESLKLSYPKVPAVNVKRKWITEEKEIEEELFNIKKLIKVACCPDCGSIVHEGDEDFINLKNVPLKCNGEKTIINENEEEEIKVCNSVLRVVDKTVSPKMRTRESIADFVFKNFKKGSYNVILDEAHECATC